MESGTTLEVSTHSGEVDVIIVSNYDPVEIAIKLNDNEIKVISLGDYIYSCIDIRNIRPVIKEILE